MRVALVVFRGTAVANIVRHIQGIPIMEVGSSRRLIYEFCRSDILDGYDFIVAAGVYTGTGSGYVHVECVCQSVLGMHALDTSLADGDLFRISNTIKRSWCNMLAATLAEQYPSARVAFLHMPSKLDQLEVARQLAAKLA